jgi:hypothetical protein
MLCGELAYSGFARGTSRRLFLGQYYIWKLRAPRTVHNEALLELEDISGQRAHQSISFYQLQTWDQATLSFFLRSTSPISIDLGFIFTELSQHS